MFNHRQEVADSQRHEVQSKKQEAERQKEILERSGVRGLFEEIVDDGTIRLSNRPVIEYVYTENRYVDTPREPHRSRITESNVIAPYAPAEIVSTDTTIALLYDHHTLPAEAGFPNVDVCNVIEFIIIDGVVNLVTMNVIDGHSVTEHTPLTGHSLEELVIKGFKAPGLRNIGDPSRVTRRVERTGDGKRPWWK